jgi:HNH endonuclease
MATPRLCSVDGCGKPSSSHGLCNMHYIRLRKHGDLNGGKKYADNSGACSVDQCNVAALTNGLCRRHNHKFKRYGSPTGGANYVRGGRRKWLESAAKLETDECVDYPFFVAPTGYGILGTLSGRTAHRFVCEIVHGEPSAGMQAAHSCNNRKCVNPRHLRWASASENCADKVAHGTQPFGEKVHNSKLTSDQVREIRLLRKQGFTLKSLSLQYGVSLCTIHGIEKNRTWAWLH